jgi:hypothetical protein
MGKTHKCTACGQTREAGTGRPRKCRCGGTVTATGERNPAYIRKTARKPVEPTGGDRDWDAAIQRRQARLLAEARANAAAQRPHTVATQGHCMVPHGPGKPDHGISKHAAQYARATRGFNR